MTGPVYEKPTVVVAKGTEDTVYWFYANGHRYASACSDSIVIRANAI